MDSLWFTWAWGGSLTTMLFGLFADSEPVTVLGAFITISVTAFGTVIWVVKNQFSQLAKQIEVLEKINLGLHDVDITTKECLKVLIETRLEVQDLVTEVISKVEMPSAILRKGKEV